MFNSTHEPRNALGLTTRKGLVALVAAVLTVGPGLAAASECPADCPDACSQPEAAGCLANPNGPGAGLPED